MPSTTFTRTPTTWLAYPLTGCFLYLQSALGPLMPFLRAELYMSYTTTSLHFSAFALSLLPAVFSETVSLKPSGAPRLLWGGGSSMATGKMLLVAGLHPVVI